jgi:UDP-glucuronate 4-epimerase
MTTTPLVRPNARILITGSAGFIGYHLAQSLLAQGCIVAGVDGMTDYYDVALKAARHEQLATYERFTANRAMLEETQAFDRCVDAFEPDVMVHLAAQAGVRYSLENPRAYIDSNIVGTLNVLEAARRHNVKHLLMASTSSVYGANTNMPFREIDKADTPLTIYAASKKANENMAHAYAHLWGLPITLFRFFTVYGPWGRPDMALFKFVDNILEGRPIDIYNHGDMYRDFTFVTDLVRGISLLIDAIPPLPETNTPPIEGDSLSPVAPHRIVNIGNSDKVRLLDFVEEIERALDMPAKRHFMPLQPGDVPATWADASLLQRLTGYRPHTSVSEGVPAFVQWFREYYQR